MTEKGADLDTILQDCRQCCGSATKARSALDAARCLHDAAGGAAGGEEAGGEEALLESPVVTFISSDINRR